MAEQSPDTIWTEKAITTLRGLTIATVFYMDETDAEEMGWVHRPLIIQFTNGSQLMAQADDEGNDGGALLWADAKESVLLPTL